MESRVPVPTDNIFKFYALFSLLLLVFSAGAAIYVQKSANEFVADNAIELELLKQAKTLTPKEEAKKAILETQFKILAADRTFYNRALGVLMGVAIVGLFYGFRQWHAVVQPMLDEQLRLQIAISKLQLEKLQSDLAHAASVQSEGQTTSTPKVD